MAVTNPQGPSQDEDFDVVLNPAADDTPDTQAPPAAASPRQPGRVFDVIPTSPDRMSSTSPSEQAASEAAVTDENTLDAVAQPVEQPAAEAESVSELGTPAQREITPPAEPLQDQPEPETSPEDQTEAAIDDASAPSETVESANTDDSATDDPATDAPDIETQEPIADQQPDEVVPTEAAATAPRSESAKSAWPRVVLELILVVAVAGLGYFAYDLWRQNASLKSEISELNSNPQLALQRQTEETIRKVGALMQLPQGETPTVANVNDAAQARKQSDFFKDAQNGDKVLMYAKAGQAILYRPATNKIVLSAPLTFNQASQNQAGNGVGQTTPAQP